MDQKVMVIDVIDVGNEQFVKNARGGYNTIEVSYKDNGKVFGKKLVDFVNKEMYAFVKSLVKGNKAEVVLEKETGNDGRDYWQWKQIKMLDADAPAPVVAEADSKKQERA